MKILIPIYKYTNQVSRLTKIDHRSFISLSITKKKENVLNFDKTVICLEKGIFLSSGCA